MQSPSSNVLVNDAQAVVFTDNTGMSDLEAVLNQETLPIPSLELLVENPNSTWDINESLLEISEISTSQNGEKLATSVQTLSSVVKSILLDLAGRLSVELWTTTKKSTSTVKKLVTSPKKTVESMSILARTLVPPISINFKKRTEKLATIEKESLSLPTKCVGNSTN